MSKPWINCHWWKGKSSQRKNCHVDGLTAGLMFHHHLTSILTLNLWTLYVARTRSKAISLKTKNSPKNLSQNEKKNRIGRNSANGRHRFRCFSCFFLGGGAYLFSFGILLIRWWCLNGFFTKAHIIWNCFPGKKWLKELLKLDDSSPSVLICCLRSFTSCFLFL